MGCNAKENKQTDNEVMYCKTGIFKQNTCIMHLSVTGEIMEVQRVVRHMFIDFNQACDSERDVLTECGVSVKIISQLKCFLQKIIASSL